MRPLQGARGGRARLGLRTGKKHARPLQQGTLRPERQQASCSIPSGAGAHTRLQPLAGRRAAPPTRATSMMSFAPAPAALPVRNLRAVQAATPPPSLASIRLATCCRLLLNTCTPRAAAALLVAPPVVGEAD
jgi:hypothetical protein